MLAIQPQMPSLYKNLVFINGKCEKKGVIVIYTGGGKANEHNIEDINAIDTSLLSGSNTALGFCYEDYIYYIPINGKISTLLEYGIYDIGDTLNIDIVFLSQKDRRGIRYLSYVSSIRKVQ
ncbi:MAG TPA: hypothetical protein PLW70_08110 [Bacteroidales bacterium]|nr:hypothetical protein [Bacteroidales bacterium]HQB19957.1 hypothetical protein [Bacteroidales bacterium]